MQRTILTAVYIIGAAGLLWLAVTGGNGAIGGTSGPQSAVLPVRMENGVQIIHVVARGGYFPNKIVAKAGIPTKLEMETKGSFDCSLSLTIPAIGYRRVLPSSGVTTIDIPTQSPGSTLRGICSMGMYAFDAQFN